MGHLARVYEHHCIRRAAGKAKFVRDHDAGDGFIRQFRRLVQLFSDGFGV